MAALPTMAKVMIIQSLACYEPPSRIVELVKQDFGIVVTRQQISAYNPENTMAKNLSQKWVDLFNHTRARFQSEISDIPIANKAYRLRMLDRMANRAEAIKNYALTAQLIEQAAKECGDAYTNKLKVETTGKDGGPIRTETTNLTAEEAGEVYRKFMG
ncbi:DUF2280 domain-containing protein [Escherichia coli]|uniref:DUF2280 domain-containing protein n=1 Tax=Enterobacteriaceae TaxID=543 RepID=UPI000666EA95|nr:MULTISPECIES: DUF2280 domain-containing protein [Enterobacteriaceae]EKX8998712.1 DUF2280 domain-containing protein [Citrobacter freundii]WPM84031.1 DUF2280 domain-containing protein [Enterobacteriaceae bacterium CA-0114]AUV30047.1 DUF2280 domain-containing protein [Escherichia coli]EEW1716106.1 DUF2280 domain-containing protein [Escherichia coli]EFB5954840.1 DUF2280 domain-containing protein [Escherichia coli]